MIRGVIFLEGSSLVVFCYLSDVKSGLIRGVVSLEERSLVVFCYLSASEIWPDKSGDVSRWELFSSILLSQCI